MDDMLSAFIIIILITIIIPAGPIFLLAALIGNTRPLNGYLSSVVIYIVLLFTACIAFFGTSTIEFIFVSPVIMLIYSILYIAVKTISKKPTTKLSDDLRYSLKIVGGIITIGSIYLLLKMFKPL